MARARAQRPDQFRQGLGDFPTFESYRDEWLLRNKLPDMRTLFSGAVMYWEDQRRVAGENNKPPPTEGRGDFVLGEILFQALDQLALQR